MTKRKLQPYSFSSQKEDLPEADTTLFHFSVKAPLRDEIVKLNQLGSAISVPQVDQVLLLLEGRDNP